MTEHAHDHSHDASAHAHDPSAHDHDHAHAHPNYVRVWMILVCLLMLSVLGPMLGHPFVTLVTAFGIAIVKAYMVLVNFMHVKLEKKYVAYLLGTMLAFMFLLFFGVAPDVMKHDGHHWENVAAKAAAKAHHASPAGHH